MGDNRQSQNQGVRRLHYESHGLVKADKNSEAGKLPSEQLLADMGKYNEQLVKAGVMLAGEGLHPSAKGARVKFTGTQTSVAKGPFSDSKDLVAGFWLRQVKSMDEAIEWLKRAPFQDAELELRQVFSPEDFAPSDPKGELRAAEARLREQSEAKAK